MAPKQNSLGIKVGVSDGVGKEKEILTLHFRFANQQLVIDKSNSSKLKMSSSALGFPVAQGLEYSKRYSEDHWFDSH